MNITFIGGGNMATAMLAGLAEQTNNQLVVVEPYQSARANLQNRFGQRLCLFASADEAKQSGQLHCAASDVLVLAVKPQVMPQVALGLSSHVNKALVLSIAAGIRVSDLSRWMGGHKRIVRAMPNTPALIGMGITGVYADPSLNRSDLEIASTLLKSIGEVVAVEKESLIDAVTAVSGSGPAYIFLMLEALQAAGEKLGLSAAQANALAKHMARGATELAHRSPLPASTLREQVTSKGGTTAAALQVLQQAGFTSLIEKALKAANDRGHDMGEEFGKN